MDTVTGGGYSGHGYYEQEEGEIKSKSGIILAVHVYNNTSSNLFYFLSHSCTSFHKKKMIIKFCFIALNISTGVLEQMIL